MNDLVASERLVAVPDSSRAAARQEIESVAVRGRGPKTGYDRDEFGPAWTDDVGGVLWGHNGCRTRDDILNRDMTVTGTRDRCTVMSGTLDDPYTGKVILFSKSQATAVQIDHVAPLSFSWQMGASNWTPAKREQFANDPLNLIAVDGPANAAKSDSGPASWLPPNKSIRCAYALRFARVAVKYDMPVPPADKTIMIDQC